MIYQNQMTKIFNVYFTIYLWKYISLRSIGQVKPQTKCILSPNKKYSLFEDKKVTEENKK